MKQPERAQSLEQLMQFSEKQIDAEDKSNRYIGIALMTGIMGSLLSSMVKNMGDYMGTLPNPSINPEFLSDGATGLAWGTAVVSLIYLGVSIVCRYRSTLFTDKIAELTKHRIIEVYRSSGYKARGGSGQKG